MAQSKTSPSQVTTIASGEIGYLEKNNALNLDSKTGGKVGDGNYTKYWRDIYPRFQGQPWCLCFIIWIFVKAFGETVAKKMLCMQNGFVFYTPTAADNFKNNNQWYTSDPQVGDIIFFKNSSRIHHVGYIYKVDSKKKIYTIEGNTSNGSSVIANGGGVCAKEYSVSNTSIAGYGRPAFSSSTTVSKIIEIPITVGRKGLEIVGATTLNVRRSPVNGVVAKTLKQGSRVMCTAKSKGSDGSYWFKTSDGLWISGKYIEGWIQESNKLWWYVTKGYAFPSNGCKKIDGDKYYFDEEGYLITPDRLSSDGALK